MLDPEWVIEQSFDRMKRELEDGECEYEEHLARLRAKEDALRKHAKARCVKRRACLLTSFFW